MNRIIGQAMARKGLYYLNSEAVHELIGTHPDDVEVQIGGLLLLPRAARAPFLETLAERFPQSPLAQYLVICQLMGNFEKKQFVQACARRWLKVEPDNFLPLYLLEHSLHLVEEERDYENPSTFPDEIWAKLIQAAKTTTTDSHFEEAVAAQKKVLNLLGFHFPTTAIQSVTPSLVFHLLPDIEKRTEAKPELTAETHLIVKRLSEIRGTGIWLSMQWTMNSLADKAMKNLPLEDRTGEDRKYVNALMTFLTIQQLPIPKLQNELFELIYADAPDYLNHVQKAIER